MLRVHYLSFLISVPVFLRYLVYWLWAEQLRLIDEQGVSRETFSDVVMHEFTVVTADGRSVPLIPGGAAAPLSFDNRGVFADLTIHYKCVPRASCRVVAWRRGGKLRVCRAVR